MPLSSVNRISPDRRLRLLIGAHLFWLLLVCLLGAWWGKLLLAQSARIAEIASDLAQWHRIQRMLYWESPTFFGLLLACSGILFWVYWGDVKRARGLQAFFASVTHELRTPLTSIRLQAESIADNLGEDHSQKDLVRRLLEDTIRLEAQVERTLELARIEGGGPVYLTSVQIKPWFDRFTKSWGLDYSNRVEFELKVEDLWIQADPTALQVIFKNLFENSVRHSGREKVNISISTQRNSQSWVALLIKDNGQGFQGLRSRLGELFQKGPNSSGTGVGLYLVKVLMKRMGGGLEYRFDRGFQVSLSFHEGQLND